MYQAWYSVQNAVGLLEQLKAEFKSEDFSRKVAENPDSVARAVNMLLVLRMYNDRRGVVVWHKKSYGIVPGNAFERTMIDVITEQLEEFINEYQRANPEGFK